MDIYKFTRNNQYYIYDSNINQIVKTDKTVYDMLPLNGNTENLTEDQQKALAEIKKYQKEHHLFREPAAQKIEIDFPEVENLLTSRLNHLILNITDQCNMRCAYCVYGDCYNINTRYSRKMTWETAKKAMDFLITHSAHEENLTIGFYGGEPLLEFEKMRGIIDYAKKCLQDSGKSLRFAITTNGTLMTEEICRFFIKEQFSVLVSLDGPKQIHDRYRVFCDGSGTWGTIAQNLKMLKEMDENYYQANIGYSSILAPPFDMMAVNDFFEHFPLAVKGVHRISYPNNLDTTFFDAFDDSIWHDAETQTLELENKMLGELEKKPYVNSLLHNLFIHELQMRWHNRSIGETETLNANGICVPGHQRTFVDTEGILYPCEKLSYRLPIGDIEKGFDFDKIKKMLDAYIEGCKDCYTCWMRRACGICFARIAYREKSVKICTELKNQACQPELEYGRRSIKLYAALMDIKPEIFGNAKTN